MLVIAPLCVARDTWMAALRPTDICIIAVRISRKPTAAMRTSFFHLCHNLQNLTESTLPAGYSLCKSDHSDPAAHIGRCYPGNPVKFCLMIDFLSFL